MFAARRLFERWTPMGRQEPEQVLGRDAATAQVSFTSPYWCPEKVFQPLDPKQVLKGRARLFTPTSDPRIDLIQLSAPEWIRGRGPVALWPQSATPEGGVGEASFSTEYETQPVYFARVRQADMVRRPYKAQRYWIVTGEQHYLRLFGDLGLKLNEECGNLLCLEEGEQRIRLVNDEERVHVSGPALFFYGFYNIYHLIMECMPILQAWQQLGIDDYKVICRRLNTSQRSVLHHFGIRDEQMIEGEYQSYHFDDLYYPSFITYGHVPAPTPWAFAAIKRYRASVMRPKRVSHLLRAVLERLGRDQLPDKIYISRADAKQRCIENEAALIQALEREGYCSVIPGAYSLEEQVVLFSEARAIVAPHGMGLTNMAWSNRLERVLEIFSSQWIRNCYFRMAQNLGVKYSACIYEPEHSSGRANIRVDVEQVMRMLAAMT